MLCVMYVAACMGYMAGHINCLLVSFSKIPNQKDRFRSNCPLVPTDWCGYVKCVYNACVFVNTMVEWSIGHWQVPAHAWELGSMAVLQYYIKVLWCCSLCIYLRVVSRPTSVLCI